MAPIKHRLSGLAVVCALFGGTAPVVAQTQATGPDAGLALNGYGMPGLLDMPTAASLPDAELATTIALIKGQRGGTLAFQITPRLTGAFRYTIIQDYDGDGETRYDRSFDLHYRLLDEAGWRPALAIGLRDFIGTGLYGGEYLVATKHLTPRLAFSGGIGWGRLASFGSFDNPLGAISSSFDTRPGRDDLGGEPNFNQWFHGPAALFAGVEWRATDKLSFKAEYSSDGYDTEVARGLIDRRSPVNVGVAYAWRPGVVLGAQYLHGSELGLSASFTLNPLHSPVGGDHSPQPLPLAVRPGTAASWVGSLSEDPSSRAALIARLTAALTAEKLYPEHIDLTAERIRIRLRNGKYDSEPQAIGQTARILAQILPPSVEVFEIEPSVQGVGVVRITLRRSDLETLEHDPDLVVKSLAAARFDPAGRAEGTELMSEGRLSWGIGPFLSVSVFDPDNPLRIDAGIEASAQYRFTPNLSISGSVQAKLIGNQGSATRVSDSTLPHVRSDASVYAANGAVGLDALTLDYLGHPGRDFYTRVSVGYLETMYGGVSAELLWKPVDSRLALGAEVNYVRQRDTDKLLGFGEYDYGVATGHLSAYYAFANGFDVQLDAGRYLAGDWGATLGIDRTFDNGWRVGAFATLTDVPFEQFGEGSFDKGIRLTIPQSWFTGKPTQNSGSMLLRPVLRDGGARLSVRNRLYGLVRGYHEPEMGDQWGRFWR